MTNFNPKNQHKSNDEWAELALRQSGNSNTQYHVIGGLFGAVFLAGATSPLTGLILGAWVIWSAWCKSGESARNKEHIISSRCIANTLEGDDFHFYRDQYGDDAIAEQLQFAEKLNLGLSNDALDFLEDYEVLKPKALPPAPKEQDLELKQAFSPFTGSGNKKIPGSTVTIVDTWNPNAGNEVDIVREMTDRLGNCFIVGIGGSGKGMLLANALREVKRKHPNKKIFLVNGKVDPKEAGYFDGIVDVEKPLHCESAKPQTVAAWFEAAMFDYDAFAVEHNGALLVIDEGTIIGARLKTAKCTTLTDKLIGITSCGGSTGKNVWFVAQTPFVGANGSDTSGISQLTPIVLVNSTNLSVVDSWKRASLFKKFDTEEIAELVDQSECNRAVYFGKTAQWYSLPKLTNYSAFNRDLDEYIGDVKDSSIHNQDTFIQGLEQQFKTVDARLTDCIYFDKLSGATEPVSFEAIRNHVKRNLPEFGQRDLIREALIKLIQEELISGNEDSGYSIT
ncbi:MAG: hypothetical protein ACFCUV_22355 [Rivularia sp. (in: cyanobacteria)]